MSIRRILQNDPPSMDAPASEVAPEGHTLPWHDVDDRAEDRYGRVAVEACRVWEAWQREDELAWLLRRIEGASSLLEVGRARGGTLWAACQVLLAEARITSIDSWTYTGQETARFLSMTRENQQLSLVRGDSVETMERMRHRTERYDVVLIDADHERVYEDWVAAQPLVRPGGVIGFHDIYGIREHTGRVPELWQTLRRHHPKTTREYVTARDAIWGGWGLIRR